jgi:hydrogenase maturation protein HypF
MDHMADIRNFRQMGMIEDQRAAHIKVTGIVQGVGFRPFVFALAERMALSGWVRNTSAGVDIVVEGTEYALNNFIDALWNEAPPLSHIDEILVDRQAPIGSTGFTITQSDNNSHDFQPISPDVSICQDCLRELFDPGDRRYRYPFINCTNCGPRFTIIQDIPYDRPNTTMAPFTMCPTCSQEYHDPRNRRFHAQPVACPDCGPKVWLEMSGNHGSVALPQGEDAIIAARELLKQGKILAVKGLGGFHLACDATNVKAVSQLRTRKLRVDKAFAVMLPNLKTIENHCLVGSSSRKLLESPEKPIVILERRSGSTITREVAPGQNSIGVLLPYTPLHHLLIEPALDFPVALVMTSGNLSDEPIVTENVQAKEQLGSLADAFLFHNREIETRCDDSVLRTFQGAPYPIRRSRGYAPFPVHLPWHAPQLLATGAQMKNTFCLTKDRYAFVSHHIGELDNYETCEAYETGIAHYERLFRVKPEAIAVDFHPDYLATRYGLDRAENDKLPVIQVQHHHAHIVACMAEHQISSDEAAIGVSFDGTGYGDDGAIWGGEILVTTYTGYQRRYHLNYTPLPGGERAVHEPWRCALSWLKQADIEWANDLPPVRWAHRLSASKPEFPPALQVIKEQLVSRVNSPDTSSMGRLFDAVSSLIGLRHVVNYEAQAAIELEALVAPHEFGVYAFALDHTLLDFTPVIREVVADYRLGIHRSVIAARFHNTLAFAVQEAARQIRAETGITKVALSGGVWQNITLLGRAVGLLKNDQFEVLIHHQLPPNDGGLSLGQAVIGLHKLTHPEPVGF